VLVAAVLALALSGPSDPPRPEPPPPPIEVLESGELSYDTLTERTVATGGVVLRRGLVVVRAQSATYDYRTGEVDAWGGVLLTEPGRALAASGMHLILDGPYHARDVVAYLKDAPLDLSRCKTLEESRATGRNAVTLNGQEMNGDAREPGFEVEHMRITLCDCGAAPPSWQFRARHATVIPNDHAWLIWPVLYITPRFLFWHRELLGHHDELPSIPVFAFPVMYVPLTDRQSGFLLPDFEWGGNNGTIISEPLFLTFGRSYDATITARYISGSSPSFVAANDRGVKGLGADLELRWAPAQGVGGIARFSLLHSTIPEWPSGAATPPGGNRIAFTLLHDERFSDLTYLKADLGFVQDPYYTADFNTDVLLRVVDYRRSGIALTHRRDEFGVDFEASYLLPLIDLDADCSFLPSSYYPQGCRRAPFGFVGSDVGTFHRLPSASVTFLPEHWQGPLRVSGTASVARFAPIHGSIGDEGPNGWGPGEHNWPCMPNATTDCGLFGGSGAWQPSERLAVTRALARLELRAPFTAWGLLGFEPWLAATGAAYAFDQAVPAQVDARAVAGLDFTSRFSRTFGEGTKRIRHDIEPRLALVAGTAQAGPGLPNYAYDEYDVSAPLPGLVSGEPYVPVRRSLSATPNGEAFSQLQLSLRNRVSFPAGLLSQTTLDLTLGQDFDVGSGRFSETWLQAALSEGLFSTSVTARVLALGSRTQGSGPVTTTQPDSFFDAFSSLEAYARLADKRGDDVHAGFIAVGKGGSPRLAAGLEPLFDPRPLAFDGLASGSMGVVAKVSGGTLSYDAFYYARDLAPAQLPCAATSPNPHVYQHVGTLVWDSPCHCWKLGVTLVENECTGLTYKLLMDFSSLTERGFAH